MRKVLVTGGAGFIGSHTVVALHQAGYQPVLVDNYCNSERSVLDKLRQLTFPELELHEVNCVAQEDMRGVFEAVGTLHGVIHFAAHKSVSGSVREPLDYYHNNVGSLVTLLRLIEEFQVPHLVFSSSCTVYGEPDLLPVTEESPTKQAESPYGFSKQICEAMLRDQVASGRNLKAIPLRYFNPIGAHPSALIGELPLGTPENLVPYITQTAAGLREQLTVFGNDYDTPDGSCIRDYIHVVDLAEAHVKALDWLTSSPLERCCEVFNVGTGRGVSVLEAVAAFEKASGETLSYRIGPRRPGDIVKIYAGVERSRDVLGWNAKLGIAEAMRDAWNWQVALGKRRSGTS
jgi:UDP-glucose 4-epimerase